MKIYTADDLKNLPMTESLSEEDKANTHQISMPDPYGIMVMDGVTYRLVKESAIKELIDMLQRSTAYLDRVINQVHEDNKELLGEFINEVEKLEKES